MRSVHPFAVSIPDDAIVDLQTRLKTSRWIGGDYAADWAYGAPEHFVRRICDHWLQFDWRAFEARINREPQITTQIDGLTIHSVNRRSMREDAVPLLLLHGWPSSFLEFLELCDPLAEPLAGEPAFHVVAPSLPGYGFSTTRPGIAPQHMAAIFAELMTRLGYERFLVQGGNWGALIGTEIARQFPRRIIGLHINSINGSPPPDEDEFPLSDEERSWLINHFSFPHFALLSQKPASAAYALNDSPMGLTAWIGEKLYDWADNSASGEPALSLDAMVAMIALYWFTQTIGSSSALYYEMVHGGPAERYVSTPTACAIFPKENVKLPRAWAERHYNIVQWTQFARGGKYPSLEVPDAMIGDIRRFAKSLI